MTGLELVLFICLCVATLAVAAYIIVLIIKNHWTSQIMDTIKEAVKKAEELYPEGHGEEKLKIVLEEVEKKCKELKIPYDLLANLITKIIKTIVENHNIFVK